MEFYGVIKSRRSVRKFTTEEVDKETLNRILEAGMWAPSAGNLQPWRFILVRDRELKEQLARIHTEYSRKAWSRFKPETAKDLTSRGATWNKKYLVDVPVWIIVCYRLTIQKGFDKHAYASSWCAIENMLLAATAENLASCPYTLANGEEQAIRQTLSMPKNHKIAAIIHIGHANKKPKPPKRRNPKTIIGHNKFPTSNYQHHQHNAPQIERSRETSPSNTSLLHCPQHQTQ
jgi:nitroreductase